ncbi:NADH-quinone oxidoreductase subunit NuoN [Epibacterium sp. SM1979]|uniref:NADH-quinone oxidoreductase subunit N n=1 Tax=Tritonibacter litoralis TaxID=2662264 RepID=A0A843Y968_9RHOB|nr:NADH-quinone oxidoreductase subunit NuoN [Tritonibacter litoralis]MQQ07551.1 NADH-quinone oxidoreductase subunit NuoN [Tritonibacter litoralis]
MIQADLSVILPEIVLALYAMGALLGAVYTVKDKLAGVLVWSTAALMVVLAIVIASLPAGTNVAFNGMFVDDAFARFSKSAILIVAAIVLIIGQEYMSRRDMLRFEYPLLVALSVVGMMMMVSAGDLMSLYMGLELQSLALYVVASLRRDSAKSTEAGLKYFVLGALSSGLLLYGASLVYGFAGTTKFSGIIQVAEQGEVTVGLLFGLIFLISGLAFKVSAAPFHMWTPDVYEGSPTPVTAFFATAPKVAAMSLFARLMFDAFGAAIGDWQQVIVVLSVLSMFLGAVAAIGQRNIKRLMAYSSIAHMGYALIGLASGTEEGVAAMLVYMVIYITMNVGTFSFILMMEKDGKPVTDIQALNLFSKKEPGKALALLVLFFSLAGVPPMLGFFAKYGVWRAGVDAGLTGLVIASAVASVIGAFYYLRIVYFMYFGSDGAEVEAKGSPILGVALSASAILMVLGVVYQFGIEGAALAAATALVN